ncbi:hypothetical protein DERP_001574 [Dermatophagoides pteronyssinus]|uniref:Uncharacterized protein n=1 Tax=Dermatophagoides pteronyssinus TaxID=6956 RepID=A0ABQ8JB24_DERPT|nr:hypothetical protein DERP_001574 [Dermatophagoides pteronyssinus]
MNQNLSLINKINKIDENVLTRLKKNGLINNDRIFCICLISLPSIMNSLFLFKQYVIVCLGPNNIESIR